MVYSLQDRLLRRELDSYRTSDIPSIYGDKTWVNDLDIVNELGGHHGCVNALSWSKSGRLLASGSDDTNIIIHSYQPDGKTEPFSLTTSISTGHTANIFSVKFMPHSNDNTLVSCAGDCQVRVFDIEHSARSNLRSSAHGGTRFMGEGDTNAKVFKSHSDRVKRIVTESSPFLFLTCSEDGEVRQWDLRQPSSAYPEPRGGIGWLARRSEPDDRVPPPLISYRRFRLDLNTLSCSGSQPHYIALGGAHLHCFLHDRRMLGRDVSSERGSPDSDCSMGTDFHGDMMGQATQCVRRFAPHGQRKMTRSLNGHITACKISDANPNELVASWSGDHIYTFDILRSPDARELSANESSVQATDGAASQESQDRKRKRTHTMSPRGSVPKHQRSRSATGEESAQDDVALRVRYENGQSEDIAVQAAVSGAQVGSARQALLKSSQKRSIRIARSVIKIRKLIFSLEHDRTPAGSTLSETLGNYDEAFLAAVRVSSRCLKDMDEVMKNWRYPVDPIEEEITFHKTMRRGRDRARRFVQAAGTLSCLLCGSGLLERVENFEMLDHFKDIRASATEGPFENHTEIFRYDFLKAIIAWLQGGSQQLIEVFRKDPPIGRKSYRFPIPANEGANSINRYLIRHLLLIAGPQAVPDLDVSRFERDESRHLFPSERLAVTAFSHAVELGNSADKEVASSSRGIDQNSDQASKDSGTAYDSPAVMRFWGLKVARGLLMSASEGVDFAFVDKVFGGQGVPRNVDAGRDQTEIDPDEDDPQVETAELVRAGGAGLADRTVFQRPTAVNEDDEATDEESRVLLASLRNEIYDQAFPVSSEDEDDDNFEDDERMLDVDSDDELNDLEDSNEDGDDDEEEDDDEAHRLGRRHRMLWQSASERAHLRETVDAHVPVNSHTRVYLGHCNVKTVKDVNFYGLQDEYIVSGSDSGHVFIWDRKTTKLLNILEGDGDVVNVVQGHPYEPMLAVSGIDYTVKIFSADRRTQRDARLGFNLAATQNQSENNFSSIGGRRRLRQRRPDPDPSAQEPLLGDGDGDTDFDEERRHAAAALADAEWDPSDEDDAAADVRAKALNGQLRRGGLASRRRMRDLFQIMAHNDLERQGGMRDAYITRGMLQQLALHLRAHRAENGEDDDDDDDGDDDDDRERAVDPDDNCTVM